MILKDVFDLMVKMTRGNASSQVEKKMTAINEGYKRLALRMEVKGRALSELISEPLIIKGEDGKNKIDLPSNFASMVKLYEITDYNLGTNTIDKGLGSELIPTNYYLETRVSTLVNQIESQGIEVLDAYRINSDGSTTRYNEVDFILNTQGSLFISVNSSDPYVLYDQKQNQAAYSFATGYNEFSKPVGVSYTVGDIGTELGSSIKQIMYMRYGAWALYDYDVSMGINMSLSTVIEPDQGYYVEMHNAVEWTPANDTITDEDMSAAREIDPDSIISYNVLLNRIGEDFFDVDNTGSKSLAAVSEPYIYFDKHISVDEGFVLLYNKLPLKLVAYDNLEISSTSGTFVEEETITGGTSTATATLYKVNSGVDGITSLFYLSDGSTGVFTVGETITGGTSGATAEVDSLEIKPQDIELSDRYLDLLANSASAYLLYLDDDSEAEVKEATLNDGISDMSTVNANKSKYKVRLN